MMPAHDAGILDGLEREVSEVTTMPTNIRQAVQEDADEIFALHQRSVHALCASHYSSVHMAKWFSGRSADIYAPALQAGRLWVAEANGQTVGFVGAEPGEVTLLFVAPEATGRAIGSVLLEFGLSQASEDFQGPLTVVATKNSASFYRRHGFKDVEEQTFVRGEPPLHYSVVKMVAQGQPALELGGDRRKPAPASD